MPDLTVEQIHQNLIELQAEVDKHCTPRPAGDKERMTWGLWLSVSLGIASASVMMTVILDEQPKGA